MPPPRDEVEDEIDQPDHRPCCRMILPAPRLRPCGALTSMLQTHSAHERERHRRRPRQDDRRPGRPPGEVPPRHDPARDDRHCESPGAVEASVIRKTFIVWRSPMPLKSLRHPSPSATVAALAHRSPARVRGRDSTEPGHRPRPRRRGLHTHAGTAMRHPAILVLGGSEGGLEGSAGEARLLAKAGLCHHGPRLFRDHRACRSSSPTSRWNTSRPRSTRFAPDRTSIRQGSA